MVVGVRGIKLISISLSQLEILLCISYIFLFDISAMKQHIQLLEITQNLVIGFW